MTDPDTPSARVDHALIVKTHWKTQAARLHQDLKEVGPHSGKQPPEFREAWKAGTYRAIAGSALELLDEILTAAQAAEGALPIPLTHGHHLVLDGERVLRVINAWQESEEDGRRRWGIVTEEEVQPAAPADATAVDLSRRYCYRLDRTDRQPSRTLSWGAWEQAPAPMTTAEHAATYEAARVRIEHAYHGPLRVWIWQARPDEHWRAKPPQNAYCLDLGTTRSE